MGPNVVIKVLRGRRTLQNQSRRCGHGREIVAMWPQMLLPLEVRRNKERIFPWSFQIEPNLLTLWF